VVAAAAAVVCVRGHACVRLWRYLYIRLYLYYLGIILKSICIII